MSDGVIARHLAKIKNMLIAKGADAWDVDIERAVMLALVEAVDYGAKSATESTTEARRLRDKIDELEERIKRLAKELRATTRDLNEYKRRARSER